MKESFEQSTRLLNESRAEVTSLKLELDKLMSSRKVENVQQSVAEPTTARLESNLSAALPILETESNLAQLDPISIAATANPKTDAGTEGVNGIAKTRISPVENTRAYAGFSFVEDILEVILENSTTLVDSNGCRTSGGHDSRDDTRSDNEHVNLRELKDIHDPVCFLFVCFFFYHFRLV